MIDLGIVKPGSTIRIPWDSYAGATGASAAASNYADADILIYKDGSTTQVAGTNADATATTSFDSIDGWNLITINLATNSTDGLYVSGSEYLVKVGPVTIDSQTVYLTAARFRIGMTGATLDTSIATLASQTSFTLTAGPAEDDALNGCVVYIHDKASALQAGFAVVSDYTGSSKTVTLGAGTTFTAAAGDNISVFPPTNVRYFGGTAGTFASGIPEVKVASIAADAITAAATATDFGAEIADAVWDEVIEGTVTGRQSMRLANAANGGEVSGADTTTIVVRDVSDTKTRITGTVDSSGNRTNVVVDLT